MSASLRAALQLQALAMVNHNRDEFCIYYRRVVATAIAEGWPLDRLYHQTGETSHYTPMWVYEDRT